MHLLTQEQCVAVAKYHGVEVQHGDVRWETGFVRCTYPSDVSGPFLLASRLVDLMGFQRPILFWIWKWDKWLQNQNMHLYYRLRQSYGDYRRLEEAPGHYFHEYEYADLVSFLEVAMLNGWYGLLVPEAHYLRVDLQDNYLDVYASDDELEIVRKACAEIRAPLLPPGKPGSPPGGDEPRARK